MPGLDYRRPANSALGANKNAPRRFYDGTPGRELVPCPRCGGPADALFGDHGGQCRRRRTH